MARWCKMLVPRDAKRWQDVGFSLFRISSCFIGYLVVKSLSATTWHQLAGDARGRWCQRRDRRIGEGFGSELKSMATRIISESPCSPCSVNVLFIICLVDFYMICWYLLFALLSLDLNRFYLDPLSSHLLHNQPCPQCRHLPRLHGGGMVAGWLIGVDRNKPRKYMMCPRNIGDLIRKTTLMFFLSQWIWGQNPETLRDPYWCDFHSPFGHQILMAWSRKKPFEWWPRGPRACLARIRDFLLLVAQIWSWFIIWTYSKYRLNLDKKL